MPLPFRLLLANLGALAALGMSAPAHAAGDGFYLGVGNGTAPIASSFAGGDYRKDQPVRRAFAGYRFGWLPILDVAVEGGYRNIGKESTSIAGTYTEVKLSGWDAAGLVILPILPVDLFAKAGLFNYSVDKTYGATRSSAAGTHPFYGVGIGVRLWRMNVRAEYERFGIPELRRSDAVSLSASIRF